METTKEKHATFTPGPWSLSLNIHDEDHGEQEYYHITAKKRMSDIGMIRVAKHKPIRTTDEANARLIAAAPDMYEMLREVLVEYEAEAKAEGWDLPTTGEMIREVLAKVEGGERRAKGYYPFNEGDDYWTIEDDEFGGSKIVWSCWDDISEEMHDENPNQVYYSSEADANTALEEDEG